MTIYFVQHGVALSKEEDPLRPISKVGIEESRRIADYIKSKGIKVEKVYHSGKRRSEETAQIFSEVLSSGQIYKKEGMAPNDNPITFCESELKNNSMYIGHLPQLEKVISYFITGNENTKVIKLVNSAVTCLEFRDTKYYLKWYLVPELI